ncbi:MAG: oligosaccharide flippase family protein [Bacilli bacterium]|nr:oligosaccharide flippase family protein [Bacilli bacterium]
MKKKRRINFSTIKKSPITKLTFGSLIAQAIAILISPITTRIYTPEQLGVYTLLLTVVTLFGPVLSAKIEMAIVTEKEEEKIYPIIVLSAIMCIILSIITIILYTIYIIITNQFNKEYILYLIIIFVYLVITGFSNILISYNNRNKDYEIISTVYVIRTIIQNLGLVVFGIMKFSIIGMLISQVVGSLFGLRKQSEKLIPNWNKLKSVKKEDLKKVLKNNYKLILYTTPATLCNSGSYSLINFFITALYGATIFGYYSISFRILGIPLSLVSTNVSKVFFERASNEINQTGKFNNTFKKISLLLLMIAIPMIVLLVLLAPFICKIVFGEEWIIAGQYIQILVFMFGIRLVVSAISPALVIAKKQDVEMKMQITFLVASIMSYLISKHFHLNIYLFLGMISVLYSIIYLVIYIYIYILSKGKEV